MAEGLSAAGTPAKPSLARPGRKIGGKKKDAKTNINVIVAGAPPKEAPMPMPPMGGPPPGPPMPPPGAGPGGPPPMPMRASGGRVGRDNGGVVRSDAGATTDADRDFLNPGKSGRYKIGGKVGRAAGGPVDGLSNDDGGAGGASGRLAKIKMYGK
jgi:hypothetical protein